MGDQSFAQKSEVRVRGLMRARAALIDLPSGRDVEVALLLGRAADQRLIALVVPADAAPPDSGEG